jgi:hydroxymethylglutaryl-CoA reductase
MPFPMNEKLISGFSKLSKKEKIDWVNTNYGVADENTNTDDFSVFFHENTAIQEVIDGFSENTISNFILP